MLSPVAVLNSSNLPNFISLQRTTEIPPKCPLFGDCTHFLLRYCTVNTQTSGLNCVMETYFDNDENNFLLLSSLQEKNRVRVYCATKHGLWTLQIVILIVLNLLNICAYFCMPSV